MYVEGIVVEGYRSFRDRTQVHFDKGHSAIVGRYYPTFSLSIQNYKSYLFVHKITFLVFKLIRFWIEIFQFLFGTFSTLLEKINFIEIFNFTEHRLINHRKTYFILFSCFFYRLIISLGVSICLDVVLIETLDLDTKKKSVSTVEKISTVSKS